MEDDPLSQENFDQPVAISSTREDHDQQRGYQVRSYECIFCKRGFSNAQALGGHMNIHRKEKAKLKQSSSSNYTPNIIQQPIWGFINSSEMDHNIIASKKWPWIFSDPDTHHHHHHRQYHATATVKDHETPTTHSGQLQQLPLFSETGNENRQSGGKGFSSSSSSRLEEVMGEDDLDLELRLGHQPRQDQSAAAAATGMKKFL